jgi:anti-sigma factor RsiW
MTNTPQPPHDPIDEREWALQEQALRAERLGLDPASDADVQGYRTVMRALKEPLDAQLPADFAAKTARKVTQRTTSDMSLELWLSYALFGVLGAMMLGLIAVYGQAWMHMAETTTVAYKLANPWLLALVACFALTAALGKLTPHHNPPRSRRLG